MTKDELLEKFGQIIISEVRDEAIDKFQMIASGEMKSAAATSLHEKLTGFSKDELDVVREVVVSSIDDVLHNFLWMIEQHEEDISVGCAEHEDSSKEDVRELSDGLSGEMYTEDGWIAKYSRYKENY